MAPTGQPAGWDTIAAEYDDIITPLAMEFAEELLDRVTIGPDTTLLDVAAGSGALSIPAARRGAQVVATDVAAALLQRLQGRADSEGLSNIATRVMDAQALDFEDATFDVAASQFGINLAADVGAAFSELGRVTRRGGRVLVASFGPPQEVEFIGFFMGALQATIPSFTPPDLTDSPPTRLADHGRFRSMLTSAGLTDINVITTNWPMAMRSGAHLWDVVLSSNPMGRALTASLTDQQCTDVQDVLDGLVRERSGGSGAVLHCAVNVALATK